MITVERMSEDKLSTIVWKFTTYMNTSTDRVTMRVNFYGEGIRETKRHKFVYEVKYDGSDRRNSTIKECPDIPEDVFQEAIKQVGFEVKK